MRGRDRVRNTARGAPGGESGRYAPLRTVFRPPHRNKLGGWDAGYFRPIDAQAALYLAVQMSPAE